jgi:hypothetical protein
MIALHYCGLSDEPMSGHPPSDGSLEVNALSQASTPIECACICTEWQCQQPAAQHLTGRAEQSHSRHVPAARWAVWSTP